MGIPVGKLSLYTALGSVDPKYCLPVTLDVGTDNEELLQDSSYLGLQMKRVRGPAYDELVDEFLRAIRQKYGANCLIQFEDFANANAFRFLEKYRHEYCMFNDDIQGTAAVVVAGLYAAVKITQKPLKDNRVLFLGAGEASIGIANLLIFSMMKAGVTEQDAINNVWLIDRKGLITKSRDGGKYDSSHKWRYAKDHASMQDLVEIINTVKPNILIGAAGVGGTFTQQVIESMSRINERPIIFALSNPTSQSECSAQDAYNFSQGKCVFASGSPFPPVNYGGKTYKPGQGNNAYIFPGVGMGIIAAGLRRVDDEVFLVAAQTLADLVKPEHLAEGKVYPPLNEIREVSLVIASKVVEYACKLGRLSHDARHKLVGTQKHNLDEMAHDTCKYDLSHHSHMNGGDMLNGTSGEPDIECLKSPLALTTMLEEPKDYLAYVRGMAYDYSYESYIPDMYDWPPSTDAK